MRALLLAGVVAAGWAGTAHAVVTYTDTFTFTDQTTKAVIVGTVSGIQNGTGLSASGLTVTVTQSPAANLLGTYNTDANPGGGSDNSYSATDGLITFASFVYQNTANSVVFFGTSPGMTFYPELANASRSEDFYNMTIGTAFALASPTATDVPEPASLTLLGMGVVGIAAVRRRREA